MVMLKYFYFNPENQVIKPYIIAQKDFCENFKKYKNEKYEKELILTKAKIIFFQEYFKVNIRRVEINIY